MKNILLSFGKIGLAFPLVLAMLLVSVDINLNGGNTLLSYVGAPVLIIGGLAVLLVLSQD